MKHFFLLITFVLTSCTGIPEGLVAIDGFEVNRYKACPRVYRNAETISLVATLSTELPFPDDKLMPTIEKPNIIINNTTNNSSRVKPLLSRGRKPKALDLFTLNIGDQLLLPTNNILIFAFTAFFAVCTQSI